MKELTKTDLIEINDYINEMNEKVGLKPETMQDIKNCIHRYKLALKFKKPKYNNGA